MKELSIEEKAKRYDESIARAKKLKETCDSTAVVGWCEYIFKELKESEDEKIRKALVEYFKHVRYNGLDLKTTNVDEVLSWLEKQGDTNETINRHGLAKGVLRGVAITLITWIDYNRAKGNMCLSNMECKVIEDALVSGDWDKIYAYIKKKLEKQGDKPLNDTDEEIVEAVKDTSVLDMVEPKFKAGQWIIDTQDGGILYINKALEYAYEVTNLNSGSYQISRCSIETSYKPWTIQDAKDGDVLFSPSHNLLWLHKDEEQCHACINLNYNDSLSIETDFVTPSDVSPATKKQRDLLFQKMKEAGYEWDAEKKDSKLLITNGGDFDTKNCEQKPTWSEDDEEEIEIIIDLLNSPSTAELCPTLCNNAIDWLITLKDRVQPKQEWSEEDKGNLLDVKCIIDEIWHSKDFSICYSTEELESLWHWLDNIWQRVDYHQDTWKPSEEQIQALEYQVHSTYKGSWQYRASKELLEQLKKF